MMKTEKKKHEPLAYISKRDNVPLSSRIIVRVVAIFIALVVCGIVTKVLTGDNPISIFKTIFHGAFGKGRMLVTIHDIAILLCISLAVTPAFRMKFWNTGAEGQVLIGCLSTAVCMFCLGGKIPNWALIIIMTVCAVFSGMLWGVIPAIFKAEWKTNETLFTLMMNYVATQLVAYFVILWEVPKGAGKIGIINQNTQAGWLPQIGSYKYLLNILIVAVLTLVMYFYLKRSKQGYEISVVGESERTARYVGINVGKVIVRTMMISGGLCGFAGLLLVGGTDHTITTTIAGGRGFTAVMVAWLAKFNPLVMVFTSLLLVFLSRGASEITTIYGLNHSFGDILTGIILFFIIGSEFFISYRLSFLKQTKKEG